jgi:hypothetical protein
MCNCKKVTHLTREAASHHVEELEARMGVRPNVYPCPEGQGFHVGYSHYLRRLLPKRARRERKHRKGIKNGKR